MAQEMQFGDQVDRDGPNYSSGGNEGSSAPPFDSGFSSSYGEKLTEPGWSRFFVVQRLTLAIVSLLTFAGICIVALPIGMNAFTFSLEADFVQELVLLGLSFYLILALVINALFHRRGSLTLAIVSLLAFAGIFIVALQIEIQRFTWSMNPDFAHGLFILGLAFSLILAIVVNALFRRRRAHLFSS